MEAKKIKNKMTKLDDTEKNNSMKIIQLLIPNIFLLVILIIFPNGLNAQTPDILNIEDFLNTVKKNHPLAKTARLLDKSAQASILMAQGGFDPKTYADWEQKIFDKKNYFTTGEYGVKLPTWYGVELKGSYNTSQGNFLNPENKLPQNGQVVVGASFSLWQGLLFDERRSDLLQARQQTALAAAERNDEINDLAFEAATTYWKWAYSHYTMEIFAEALRLAEVRFGGVKVAFEQGDRMAMDTLEAFIQVQERQLQLNDAMVQLRQAQLKLNNFLWSDDGQPLTRSFVNRPDAPNTPLSNEATQRTLLRSNLENAAKQHPTLLVYKAKLSQLETERRLKREKLKPSIKLNYNFLGNGTSFNNLFTENYKWGVQFSFAPLLRKERGGVLLTNIKIENTQLFQAQKAIEIANKTQQFLVEVENLFSQQTIYERMVSNYTELVRLENARFQLGESSLFLINSREVKLIESRVKLLKLQTEINIAINAARWAGGVMWQ